MHILRHITLLVSVLLTATQSLLQDSVPEPYHMSSLSGQEWVMELIMGHSECIHCELRMDVDAFYSLIVEHHALGHASS